MTGLFFESRIRYTRGEMVLRDQRFWYLDLIPVRSHHRRTCVCVSGLRD